MDAWPLPGAEHLGIDPAVAADDPAADPALARPRLGREPLVRAGEGQPGRGERRREAGPADPRIALAGKAAAMSAPGAAKSRWAALAGFGQRAAAASTPVTAITPG